MPHPFSFVSPDDTAIPVQELDQDLAHKQSRKQSFWRDIGSFWKRPHRDEVEALPQLAPIEQAPLAECFPRRRRSLQEKSTARRRVIPSLPRPQTFTRQESEKRERLEPTLEQYKELGGERRRALSASAARRATSPPIVPFPSLSAPEVHSSDPNSSPPPQDHAPADVESQKPSSDPHDLPPLDIPEPIVDGLDYDNHSDDDEVDRVALEAEYEQRWILNLSMHFRDKSNREKFFVTYAETPSKWRRLTVSLDYRDAPEDSLEADLSTLQYQRDKSFRIYEAIRESLPDIQFYDTVTNLKLETTPEDGQLHVHVREDANEMINYPSISLFHHVQIPRFTESEVDFISHLSGFVYKVHAGGRTVIKKEIPGPDTVDEFLYEVNALDSLRGCESIIQLEGLVTNDSGDAVKGLLISYAPGGALVDILYDYNGGLHWYRREKWAKQIVQGLSDIHESGFVQGDFTLSNIVIDEYDNAKIIDINRRGCPVGWEPPELSRLIDSGQRISMCISVKTDLYQLGMVLWALAEQIDEPERVERPLARLIDGVPAYYSEMVEICLSERPQSRWPANRLLRMFPDRHSPISFQPPLDRRPSSPDPFHSTPDPCDLLPSSTHRSAKEYIDPDMAITLEEVRKRRTQPPNPTTATPNDQQVDIPPDQVTYLDPATVASSYPASTTYHFDSSGSWIVGRSRSRRGSSQRGGRRSSPLSSSQRTRRPSSPLPRSVASSRTSVSSASSAGDGGGVAEGRRGKGRGSVDDEVGRSDADGE
ncbi:kinase-like protein [Hortaea werneckii]|nr:kinase-like protein [Hortaea werneckii]KAI7110003.1 kinase-like protein [Hortaea werneckii]KAI7243344.1 kinase-like protein [Hortaea werneckii]KAI7314550.1 kinase-like protein [Hortaea werneckii]KAI7402007.1 kinase-like protein [Hortaea werneckii]